MKKLKTLLPWTNIFSFLIIVTILYALLITNFKNISKYKINDKEFILQITDIYIDGNYLKLDLKGKEKLIGVYYFDSLESKESFVNKYELGSYIKIEGDLEIPSNNTNPNVFNYKKYLNNEGIHYILNINQFDTLRDNDNFLYEIKNKIIERIDKIKLSAPYLHTLILGNNNYLDINIKNTYQNIGISHLFSISGMHISIFSSILLWILKKIPLASSKRYIVVIIFLLFYMFLTNFSSSVLRAGLFFIILSLTKIFNIKIKTINILLLTLSLIILVNPHMIYKIGFLYSSITSFSIISFKKIINKRKNYFTKLLITSTIAFFVSFPISIYNFYQVNGLSIIYNLLFVPIVSVILFPLSLITLFIPILDNVLYLFINLFEKVANLCNLVPSIIILKKPNLLVCLLYYFIIFGIFLSKNHRKAFIVTLLLIFLVHYNYNSIFKSDYLIVLDVGQGDSILIHFGNESILIDSGGKVQYNDEKWKIRKNKTNMAESTIIPLLKSLGIRSLKTLIFTHGDYDHIEESINLLNHFKVDKVVFNKDSYNDLEHKVIELLKGKKIKYYKGMERESVGNYILYSLNTRLYDNENDNSNVIYFNYNRVKILLMGDAGTDREKDILEKYHINNIDILKVGHHGSNTSSSKMFVNMINPKISLISVGKDNRYGHPKEEVLDNLSMSQIYRTDENGCIVIKLIKNRYQVKTCI